MNNPKNLQKDSKFRSLNQSKIVSFIKVPQGFAF